ncbi:hypothetical protein Taro_015165, partial [Colocasia esculenta]|nr:hypothetical protein [Colocasia esculenta]
SPIPTSPDDETRPTESSVGLQADGVNTIGVLKLMASTQPTSPDDETRSTEFPVDLEADGVDTTDVPR